MGGSRRSFISVMPLSDTGDMRMQHVASISQDFSSLIAFGQETKQVRLLKRPKPDRTIIGEIFQFKACSKDGKIYTLAGRPVPTWHGMNEHTV
jgi:hypothetical protein